MTKLEKILNNLSLDMITMMQAASPEQLKTTLVLSEQAIAEAKEQLDNNPGYKQAKEDIKTLSSGYRELKKYQAAKIQYALVLLQEKGE